MSFLDSIKDRFGRGSEEPYEDDYYEEDGYYDEPRSRASSSPRLLGTTPRPEAESVSVYTRSGRPVTPQPTSFESRRSSRTGVATPAPVEPWAGGEDFSRTSNLAQPTARPMSGQLPPYVLRPVAYEDVQTVVRRVRTNQPVVLVFRNTNIEVAKRILDFSFGLSQGMGGEVRELGERVFVVLPPNMTLSQSEIDKLVADGDLVR